MTDLPTPEELAQLFHETYERLAPEYGYKTREASAKPWSEVPEDNRNLMVATCKIVLERLGQFDELPPVKPFTLADVQAGAKVLREAPTWTHDDGFVYLDKDGPIPPEDTERTRQALASIDGGWVIDPGQPTKRPALGSWGVLSHVLGPDDVPIWDGGRPIDICDDKAKAEARARDLGAFWVAPIEHVAGGWLTGDTYYVEREDALPVPLTEQLAEVTGLHEPDDRTIDKLRELLDLAEAGQIRGLMYAALDQGNGNRHLFGHAGSWDVAVFAMGVRLLDHQLGRLIEGESETIDE